MTTNSSVQGYAPIVKVEPGNKEAQKYIKMWEHPEYRRVAPGEAFAPAFLQVAKPKPGSHVIDFGCGTGRGGAVLATTGRLKVTLIDFVNNCLDTSVKDLIVDFAAKRARIELGGYPPDQSTTIFFSDPSDLQFIKADLEKHIPVAAEYGFCTDVMEHIPPDKVDACWSCTMAASLRLSLAVL